jgi:hypothetical protein
MGKRGHHPVAPTHGFNDPEHGRSIFKRMVGGTLRNHAQITCGCGRTDTILMKMVLPEDVICKKFRQQGWDLDPDTCPSCVEKRRDPKPTTEEEPMTAPSNVTPITPQVVPSQASIRGQAIVMRLLTEHFDETQGLYENDYSDERIAKFRREAFGELRDLKDVRELKDDLAMLEMRIEDEFTGLTKSLGEEVAKLRARVAELERRAKR